MRFTRILPLLFTSAAFSCPLCHTQTGEQVRAGIFNPNFGANLFAVALPFPVFAVVVAWLYFGKTGPGARSALPPQESGPIKVPAHETNSAEGRK